MSNPKKSGTGGRSTTRPNVLNSAQRRWLRSTLLELLPTLPRNGTTTKAKVASKLQSMITKTMLLPSTEYNYAQATSIRSLRRITESNVEFALLSLPYAARDNKSSWADYFGFNASLPKTRIRIGDLPRFQAESPTSLTTALIKSQESMMSILERVTSILEKVQDVVAKLDKSTPVPAPVITFPSAPQYPANPYRLPDPWAKQINETADKKPWVNSPHVWFGDKSNMQSFPVTNNTSFVCAVPEGVHVKIQNSSQFNPESDTPAVGIVPVEIDTRAAAVDPSPYSGENNQEQDQRSYGS